MTLVDEVTHRAEERWGHPLDSVDRSAVALVIADRRLHDVAGTDEDAENAAFHVQHGAFDLWWAECRRAERDCNHPEMDAAWIRDLSYGGAASALDDFLANA